MDLIEKYVHEVQVQMQNEVEQTIINYFHIFKFIHIFNCTKKGMIK